MKIEIIDLHTFALSWWVVLLRGVAGVILGLVSLMVPGISLTVLVLAFGAYAAVDGGLAMVTAIRGGRTSRPRWGLVLEGLLGIGAGAATLAWPGLTALALTLLVGTWAFLTGVLGIVTAVRLRKALEGEWLLAVSGVASVFLGLALLLFPGPGALALVLWLGAYALVFGVLLMALGLRLRSWKIPSEILTIDEPSGAGTPQHG